MITGHLDHARFSGERCGRILNHLSCSHSVFRTGESTRTLAEDAAGRIAKPNFARACGMRSTRTATRRNRPGGPRERAGDERVSRGRRALWLRDPSEAKVSLSPNLGDLCGRRAVQGQTSSARTDGIIVTYIDEHVIGDDEKHKDAGLGRFGDGQKLPPKIIVFDPGIDLCGSRAENGSYTPTSTQLSIAFPSGFGESIEGKPDTEYAMSSKTIDGPYIEHIAIEVDNGNLELNLKDRVQSPSDIEVKGIYLDAHIDVFLSSEEEFDKKFTDRTVKESLMSSFAGAKKFMGQAPWLK